MCFDVMYDATGSNINNIMTGDKNVRLGVSRNRKWVSGGKAKGAIYYTAKLVVKISRLDFLQHCVEFFHERLFSNSRSKSMWVLQPANGKQRRSPILCVKWARMISAEIEIGNEHEVWSSPISGDHSRPSECYWDGGLAGAASAGLLAGGAGAAAFWRRSAAFCSSASCFSFSAAACESVT